MAIDATTGSYIHSEPLIQKKFTSLEEAQKLAQKTDGSEAIVKHQGEMGNAYYTVHKIDNKDIREFNQTELDPNLVCFSIDLDLQAVGNLEVLAYADEQVKENLELDLAEIEKSTVEQIKNNPRLDRAAQSQGYESALAYKQAPKEFENFLPEFLQVNQTDSIKNRLKESNTDAQAVGFTDLASLKKQLKQLPPSQRDEITKILGNTKLTPAQKNEQAAALFKKEFNVDVSLSKEQWSGAGVVALLDAFNKLKAHSPDQLATAAKLTYVYETKTTEPKETYSMNFMELLNNNMKIAHTCTSECVVTIHEGAIKGTSESVIQDKAAILEQKLAILERKINKSAYSNAEIKTRGLAPINDSPVKPADLDKAKSLFWQFTQKTSEPQKNVYFQMAALLNALKTHDMPFGDIKNLVPSLKAFFPDTQIERGMLGGVNVTLKKLSDCVFGEHPPDKDLLAAMQADVDKLLGKMSYIELTDAVFVAEKMHETRSLQAFLNQTNPSDVPDLKPDGLLSDQTNKEIARFQFTVICKSIENKLPKPPDPQALQALEKIKTQLFESRLSKREVANEIQTLIWSDIPGLSPADNATFAKDLSAIYANVQLGQLDSATLHSLIDSWLQMVDGNREGQIGSDLILHEIGHNLMQQKIDNPNDGLDGSTILNTTTLQSDWNAIGGFVEDAGAFTMDAATESFLIQEKEEVSDYGQTNGSEDFAEAFRLYNSNPKELLAKAPTKFLMLNAIVNNKPADAQKKLDELMTDLKRSGKKIDLKPSLDKILGYDLTSKSHISPQMVEKLTQTYTEQFKGYIPPKTTQESGLAQFSALRNHDYGDAFGTNRLVSTQLSEKMSRILDVYETAKTLMKHIPAPVGTHYDEAKLKALVGAERYNLLPESFKVMLSGQDSSPLLRYLVTPTTPLYSPELMTTNLLRELNQRECLAQTQNVDYEYADLQITLGFGESEVIDALEVELNSDAPDKTPPSDTLKEVLEKINTIVAHHNATHLAPKIELVNVGSPQFRDFIKLLPEGDEAQFVQKFNTAFDLP